MHLAGRHPPAAPQSKKPQSGPTVIATEIADLDDVFAAAAAGRDRFDLTHLCGRLGQLRGRRIGLLPVSGHPPATGCQPWMVTDRTGCAGDMENTGYTDYVVVEQNTTPLHRNLLALHAVAHLLLGHPGRPVDAAQELAGRMPQLDWQRLRPLLGAAYTAHLHDEAAADDLAVQILQHAGQLPRITRQPWPTNPTTAPRRPR